MQIYDVKIPQGFFCQSKADVKCKEHLEDKPYIVFQGLFDLYCLHTSDNLPL